MRRTVPRRFLGTRYRIMASAELKIRAPRGSLARSVVPRFRDCGDIRFSFVHANADDCNYVSKNSHTALGILAGDVRRDEARI